MTRRLVLGGLLMLAVAMACLLYRQRAEQRQLDAELQVQAQVLDADNNDAGIFATKQLAGIEASLIRNQTPSTELKAMTTALAWKAQADSLISAVRADHDALLLTTADPQANPWQQYFSQASAATVAELLNPGSLRRQVRQQQLIRFATTARQLHAADSLPLAFPALEHSTGPVALARLTQLETRLLARENSLLRQLASTIKPSNLATRLVALAVVAADTVAPGTMYRARLLLPRVVQAPGLRMSCDDRLITVGANGVGQVRFRASTQPGQHIWRGTIQAQQGGRNTTFEVHVPYQVVHH